MDLGATHHTTSNKDVFTSYKIGNFGIMNIGNYSHSKILGICNVCLQTDVRCTLLLKDIRHVLDLRLNLISYIVLDREGYHNSLVGRKWKLTKESLVVARGSAYCSMYKTYAKVCKSNLNTIQENSSADLWHKRLGHMSEK